MILEKIKEHSGKIAFFTISFLLIVIGAMYLNQKNLRSSINGAKQQGSNLPNSGVVGGTSVYVPTVTSMPSATTRVS